MGAGAWAAAWQEMEQVDVEINVWLPEDIRQELEAKLALLEGPQLDTSPPKTQDTWMAPEPLNLREREVYGEPRSLDRHTKTSDTQGQPLFAEEASSSTLSPATFVQQLQAQVAWYAENFTRGRITSFVGMLSLLALFSAVIGVWQDSSKSESQNLAFDASRAAGVLTTTIMTTVSTATVRTSSGDTTPTPRSRSEQVSTEDLGFDSGEDIIEMLDSANVFNPDHSIEEDVRPAPEEPRSEVTDPFHLTVE